MRKGTVSLTPGSDDDLTSGAAPVAVTFLNAASAAERGSLGRVLINPFCKALADGRFAFDSDGNLCGKQSREGPIADEVSTTML